MKYQVKGLIASLGGQALDHSEAKCGQDLSLYSLPRHASALVRSELLGLESRAYAQLGEREAAHAARSAETCVAVYDEAPADPAQRAYAKWGWRAVAQKRNPLPGSPIFDVLVKEFPPSPGGAAGRR